MAVLDELAAFVTGAKASSLPAVDRAILRRHVADVVAARLAGAAASEGKAVSALYPAGQGLDSIAGLAALVRLTETDDIHRATGTTPSSVAVPVALALAAESPCSASDLESAVYVGLETTVRVGKAAGGAGILYQGIWPTRAGATLGAAAAACRVWGLSEPATRHALSMAVLLTSGRTGRFESQPSARWVLFAHAVASGLKAAQAARAGFTSDLSVLDTNWLERAFGVPFDNQAFVDRLGKGSVFPELSMKPYCTSRQALPGAEAMRALIAEGLDPADVVSFTIKVPKAYAGMISQKLDPAVHASTYVSGAGLAAIAALQPDALYDIERESVTHDARIMELAGKGQVIADRELDSLYPVRWPARIEVTTRSGTLRHEMLEPKGDPGNPIGDRELEDKVTRVLQKARRADLVALWQATAARPFETDAAALALARYFVAGASTR